VIQVIQVQLVIQALQVQQALKVFKELLAQLVHRELRVLKDFKVQPVLLVEQDPLALLALLERMALIPYLGHLEQTQIAVNFLQYHLAVLAVLLV
jgi:hypothetical protein